MSSNYPTYLVHHGIKGQQWGIRRYQNEDGTLTPEGKQRYLDDLKSAKKEFKSARRDYNKYSYLSSQNPYSRTLARTTKEKHTDYMYKKRQYEDLKDSFKMQTSKKDDRQKRYEDEYIKKGMNKEDAELQAFKRRRTEKILMATAAVSVAAIAGIAAYKIYKNNADRVIRKGTKLNHIVDGEFRGVEDAFVARANNPLDTMNYRGMYANQLKQRASIFGTTPDIKNVTIEAGNDVKIASKKSARKALEEMFRENPEAMREFKNNHLTPDAFMAGGGKQGAVIAKAYRDLERGKVTDSVYEAFNLNFVGPNKQAPLFKQFTEKLNKKGYGAILDMNDYKLSGYGTKDPLILIDRNNNFSVKDIRKVSDNEINLNNIGATGRVYLRELAPYVAVPLAAKKATDVIGDRSYRKRDNELVAKYQKEHPGTKMTYNEILRDIYKR